MLPHRSPAALLVATLALVQAYGCGSVSTSPDGGSGAAGQAGAGHGGAGDGGAAGTTGTAGSTGPAGHGGGGSNGTAGHDAGATDAGAATCADLVEQYSQALAPARSCTPGATGQCQRSVSSSLSPCSGCMIYVNDASTLNDIKSRWQAAGCANGTFACPAIACLLPPQSVCTPADGGGGTCASTSGLQAN